MFIACLLAVKYKTLRDWCWSWNSNTLATWCEEMTHWKRPWCWERLKVGGEGGDRGWDGWMASPTQWTWVWVNSGRWWWTGMDWHAAVHGVTKSWTRLSDWTELNWKRQQFCLFIDESWCLAYNNCLIGICQMNVDASFHFPLQLKMGEVCFLHKVNSQPGFCVSQYVSPDPITHSSGGVC